MPPLEGLGLSVDLKNGRLFRNGEFLFKKDQPHYEVIDSTGQPANVKIFPSIWPHLSPKISINGIKHNLIPPLRTYQHLLVMLPLFAIILFRVFVMPGAPNIELYTALPGMLANIKIFRSSLKEGTRIFLSILTAFGSVLLYWIIFILILFSTGRIDYDKVMTDAHKKGTQRFLTQEVKRLNNNGAPRETTKDGYTVIIETITTEDTSIIFPTRMFAGSEELDAKSLERDDVKAKFIGSLKNRFCRDGYYQAYKDYKVVVIDRIKDSKGNILKDFSFDTSTCP